MGSRRRGRKSLLRSWRSADLAALMPPFAEYPALPRGRKFGDQDAVELDRAAGGDGLEARVPVSRAARAARREHAELERDVALSLDRRGPHRCDRLPALLRRIEWRPAVLGIRREQRRGRGGVASFPGALVTAQPGLEVGGGQRVHVSS